MALPSLLLLQHRAREVEEVEEEGVEVQVEEVVKMLEEVLENLEVFEEGEAQQEIKLACKLQAEAVSLQKTSFSET